MTDILVYDSIGNVVNSICIDDNLEYVDGRVCKGNQVYYKGLGVPYTSHHTDLQVSDEYDIISESPIFYLGTQVSKKCFQGKVGIFQEKFQPQFTDWIGSCGIKELNILENLYDEPSFEKNSIDVLGYETIDESSEQYYLKVLYHCDRIFYMQQPHSHKLRELLDYMIVNNWNFPWDKNSISDISYNGLVTDVVGNGTDTYKNIIMNYLVVGKNCGYCGVGSCKNRIDPNQSYGEYIRNEYINRTKTILS